MDPDVYEAIVRLKEKVQYADLKAHPTQVKCNTYFKDFPNEYNYVEVANIYNDLLYKAILNKQNDSTILCYFNDTTLKTFYANSKEPRPYLAEVQKLYDDCLFKAIQTATSPDTQKHCIHAYIECPYLAGCNRKYLPQVEYTNDSIDLILLVSQVDSFPRLPLIKTYLQTHKYKPFRDKAQQLRKQFIDSMTYISPTITRCYSGINITRETRIHHDSLTITTYHYSPQGLLTRIIQSTRLQKDSTTTTPLNLIVTTFRYNDLGKCYEEETIDSLAKATICLINYQYDTTSHPVMKTTKWSHGQNTIDYYNHRGQVNRTQEYRNGLICAQTDYTYDPQGRLSGKTWINTRPDTDHPATKQVTLYIYDSFGYLTSISYVKENLQNEKKAKEYLGKIQSSSNLLLMIINQILEMARIESGTAVLQLKAEDMDALFHRVNTVFEEDIRKKNLQYYADLDIRHHYVVCDQTKLQEIMLNIISNAIKYTPEGHSIYVEIHEAASENPSKIHYIFSCEDTGIGMSEEYLPHVYEEFSREHTTTENKVQGTGLGLSIIKSMIELMDGSIQVESRQGIGTKFTVDLSFDIASKEEVYGNQNAMKPPAIHTIKGTRILLVEDNELNAEIAKTVLEDVGALITRVEDGQQAVKLFKEKPAGTFDAILMDLMMPVMDGYTATKKIRSLECSDAKTIPIIAMTANAFQEDAEKCIAVGMNAHLAKPLNIEKMMTTICHLVKKKNE